MIDIASDELVPLSEAASRIPSSRGKGSVHLSTIHRWRVNGVRGIRLETTRIGGCHYTSTKALRQFLAALNSDEARGDQRASTPATQSRARQAEINRAERELSAAGI